MKNTPTRRNFLKQAAFAAAAAPMVVPARVLGRDGQVAPSNRIVMAGIGIGGRGQGVLGAFLEQKEVQFVAICDVQERRRKYAKGMVDSHNGNRDCHTCRDLHEVLAREDIDAVLIATGDRWHAPASILAAHAGKDIYCEKPCSLTLAETIELDDAVRGNKRIFQAGTQRRTVPNFKFAVELARSGKLGRLQTLHASINKLGETHDHLPAEEEPPPEVVDWDRWLGPAPRRAFNQTYIRGGWRGHYDFDAGARLLDWGAHTGDLCQWAANADDTTPVEFTPSPDRTGILATYASGLKLVMRLGGFNNEGEWLGLGTCPVRFEGDEGWVETGDSGELKTSAESLLAGLPETKIWGTDPKPHVRDFLDCVRSRGEPASSSRIMRQGHVACHAASIAWRLKRTLRFDPATDSFPGEEEANKMRARERRAPWDKLA
jgi:predicted dehydrogenase